MKSHAALKSVASVADEWKFCRIIKVANSTCHTGPRIATIKTPGGCVTSNLAGWVEKGGRTMETINPESLVGRHCRLLRAVRDSQGRSRFTEEPVIVREVDNLGRHMLLVQFDDGSTTFLFPTEVAIQN
jgi:hypothetical protein